MFFMSGRFTSFGSKGRLGHAKTIISPNTSFGDINKHGDVSHQTQQKTVVHMYNKAIRDGRPRPPRHQVGWDIVRRGRP